MQIRFFVFFLFLSLLACEIPPSEGSKKPLPEPDSAGATALKQYCANCHGLPRPTIHKQNEWRNVVYRMNLRRIKRALGAIPETDFENLVNYMEKHSQ
jgi:hypothetical protein